MSNIKVREVVKGTIKTIDKEKTLAQKTKDGIVDIKNKSENTTKSDENNANEYAVNRINGYSKNTVNYSVKANKKGIESVKKTKENFIKSKAKIKNIKIKIQKRKQLKNTRKGIKTSSKVAKQSTKQVAKQTVKTSERAVKLAQKSIKATYHGLKVAVKATVSSIKAIIAGTKALISFLVAGGWVAAVIIILICLIGLLFNSIFGIFFSNENIEGSIPMSSIVTEINQEMANKILEIQNNNPHDDYTIDSNRADWKDILTIYTVKVANGINETDVITMDENKKNILKQIFWDMNSISYEVKDELVDEDMTDKKGTPQKVQKKILHITITSKTIDEMKVQYHFNSAQLKQLEELRNPKYAKLWSSPIYGTSLGKSSDVIEIARSQLGNVGGEPYWKWYGFNSRIEWCATFVSWVADQSGYLANNILPKSTYCRNMVEWFKAMNEWQSRGYIPKSGDVIFFDWEHDGIVNHVGFVEKVEKGKVYTIEGNSDDAVRENKYSIDSKDIFGYGTPAY